MIPLTSELHMKLSQCSVMNFKILESLSHHDVANALLNSVLAAVWCKTLFPQLKPHLDWSHDGDSVGQGAFSAVMCFHGHPEALLVRKVKHLRFKINRRKLL